MPVARYVSEEKPTGKARKAMAVVEFFNGRNAVASGLRVTYYLYVSTPESSTVKG